MIDYLTGANDKMFGQTLVLLQAVEEVGASGLVRVCDLGLTEGERRFLDSLGRLAVADPPLPGEFHHPWYHKAALVDYARPDAETVVWIDADMILMTDPRPHVDALLDEMRSEGRVVAAAPDYHPSIGESIRHLGSEGYDVSPFVRRLREHGISIEHPYLNSAFIVADSREMLDAWKRITLETPEHCLWEQNAFNVAAWRDPGRVTVLDRGVWNLFGDDMAAASLSEDGSGLLWRGRPVVVLHTTGKFCENVMRTFDVRGVRFSTRLRAITEPHLRKHQLGLLDRFVQENEDALIELL